MTMQLYVIYQGITLDFQANGYTVLDGFYPETPDEGMKSISDQFTILIKGSSGSDLKAKIQAITLAFEDARRHKDDSQVAWFYYDIENTGDAWMSKVLSGSVIFNQKLGQGWRQNKITATVIIEHSPYWDAKTEIQIPLTNGNGNRNTSGLTVFNHDDGGTSPAHDNWVSIEDSDVLGDLPGPTRLEMINSYNNSARLDAVWIGQNWTDPANFTHIFEGEAATGITQVESASCSNGYYGQFFLGSGSEVEMFKWPLSSAFLNASQGKFYKFLVRFESGDPPNVKFRFKLQYVYTDIWQAGQVTVDHNYAYQIRDLTTLRLPPWLLGETGLYNLDLILTGQLISGSQNVNIDFLQITPVDGWRHIRSAGYGAIYGYRYVDDGFHGVKYIDNGSGSNKSGNVIGWGSPIQLYPGKDQKLYFLMHSWYGNTAEIARTLSVKLYHRPRKKTL